MTEISLTDKGMHGMVPDLTSPQPSVYQRLIGLCDGGNDLLHVGIAYAYDPAQERLTVLTQDAYLQQVRNLQFGNMRLEGFL